MRVFKLQASSRERFDLTLTEFEKQTRKRRPWFQSANAREDEVCRAVCPECLNPIRIIGLYRPIKNGVAAYGKHIGERQEGFPVFDAEAHEYCPYMRKQEAGSRALRAGLEGLPLRVLMTVIENYDHVIRILKEDSGVIISKKLAGNLLDGFLGTGGYRYVNATVSNAPWMVAYMTEAFSIYGQYLRDDAAFLRGGIAKVPGGAVSPAGRIEKEKTFFGGDLSFAHHKAVVVDDRLMETLELWVQSHEVTPQGNAKIVGEKTITIEPRRFEALVAGPADQQTDDQALLDLARERLQAHNAGLAARVFQALENPAAID